MARILLVGPGAIGAFIGARLAASGHDLLVACRTVETAERILQVGLVATDHEGRATHADVRVLTTPEELTDDPDLAIIATKCADAEAAVRDWSDVLPLDCPVVAMQNGLMGDRLAPHAGGRLIESVVAFPATLEGIGRSIQTGPGGILIGAWPPTGLASGRDKAEAAAVLLRDAVPTDVRDDIEGAKWTKLIINACITSLGVVTGRDLGDLLRDPRARDAFLAITTEGHRTGQALGVDFEKVAGFTPRLFAYPDGPSFPARLWRHQLLKVVGRKHRRQRSSSLQSLERGRKTEVDELNGALVRAAHRQGVPVPTNETILALVHDIEAGRRPQGMENLDDVPRTY
ncbi:MAG: 2-dehydropantoate 2-reductase [Euryarchaeota archaeon]|nr:2-dehydropantoate 2-reductase [Euryarchaeota archaeon]